jgi:Glycosyl transferase family 2
MENPRHPPVSSLDAGVRPRVTVVVPCFNYGRWLAGCVESALLQPGVQVNVVIVDDASNDNSLDVARGLARCYPGRIHLVAQPRNRGHIPSVNEGMRHVSGDYVVKLDADDILAPGCLARACAFLEACPQVGFVYGRPVHFGASAGAAESRLHRLLQRASYLATDEPGVERLDFRVRGWTLWPGLTWIERVCARGSNCISQPEAVMRAQTLRAAGAYDERLPHTSDLNMWLRLAALADVGHIAGAVQGLYREHAGSMQRTVNAGRLRDLRGRLDAFESALGQPTAPLLHAPELLALARAKLASEALEQACHAFDRGRTANEPIDEYVAFALQAHGDATALPQWRALKRRRRVGADWSQWYPPFLVQTALSRALNELRAAHWRRHGV